MPEIAPDFRSQPFDLLTDAALSRACALGASHADFRLERIRVGSISLRDGTLESSGDHEDLGIAVRVVHNGAWGFASGIDRTPQAAALLAEQAVATAKLSRVLSTNPVELAAEAVHRDVEWVSAYEIDPFEVAEAFEVPLSFVADSKNHRRTTRELENRTRVFFVLPFEGRNIWGATAGMLVNLAEVLGG